MDGEEELTLNELRRMAAANIVGGASLSPEARERIRRMTIGLSAYGGVTTDQGFSDEGGLTTNTEQINMTQESSIKKLMKQRHLTKGERDTLHRPLNDWKETPRGEVCINASSLPLEDILTKHKVKV